MSSLHSSREFILGFLLRIRAASKSLKLTGSLFRPMTLIENCVGPVSLASLYVLEEGGRVGFEMFLYSVVKRPYGATDVGLLAFFAFEFVYCIFYKT